jgi:hypothetical protein
MVLGVVGSQIERTPLPKHGASLQDLFSILIPSATMEATLRSLLV